MQKLKFGTAGIREKNLSKNTVKQVANGYALYLKENIKTKKPIFIGYDTRDYSKYFAKLVSGCLAAYGINSLIFNRAIPVSILSYVVNKYGSGGVMITASHNPKEYNGIKIYDYNGKQILQDTANKIETKINNIKTIKYIQKAQFISNRFINEYLEIVNKNCKFNSCDNLKIIYTPLSGAGKDIIEKSLSFLNAEVFTVANENKSNLNIDIPNPELIENYTAALEEAEWYNADLILATDCDCDRVGCMVKYKKGYTFLTGNDLGILITKFLLDNHKEGTIVTTNVSTSIISKMYKDTKIVPVGFKNIANQIDNNFLFGFEDTNGFIYRNYTYDKDGITACSLIAQIISYYKSKQINVVDLLDTIRKDYGNYKIKVKEFNYKLPLKIYTQIKVFNIKITIRTSGTEPKIKIYTERKWK